MTPLVEDVDSLLSIEKILQPYWSSLVKEKPDIATRGQRIFLTKVRPGYECRAHASGIGSQSRLEVRSAPCRHPSVWRIRSLVQVRSRFMGV